MELRYGFDKHLRCWNYTITEKKKIIKAKLFLSRDEVEASIEEAKGNYPEIEIIKEI